MHLHLEHSKGAPAVAEQTPQQQAAYAEVSDALDVRDAVAHMQLDAEQMAGRAAQLYKLFAEADAQAAPERRAADLE